MIVERSSANLCLGLQLGESHRTLGLKQFNNLASVRMGEDAVKPLVILGRVRTRVLHLALFWKMVSGGPHHLRDVELSSIAVSNIPEARSLTSFYTTATAMNTRKHRGRGEIVRQILLSTMNGLRKTHIMYKVNLNYKQLSEYLGLLKGYYLIEEVTGEMGNTYFKTTDKGRLYIAQLGTLYEMLGVNDEEEVANILSVKSP